MASLGLVGRSHQYRLVLTFNKVDSANVNEKYAMKVANDYAYQKFRTAEEAASVRGRQQKGQEDQKIETSSTKTNVPKWSNQNIKIKPARRPSGTRTKNKKC